MTILGVRLGVTWMTALLLIIVASCRRVATADKADPGSQVVESARPTASTVLEQAARGVKDVVIKYCERDGTPASAKEVVSAMAAVVGERCIDAAGEYSPRAHSFVPGQRVFSDKINFILLSDRPATDMAAVPEESVFGMLRSQLIANGFKSADFPSPDEVVANFARHVGRPEHWGKVPLSLPLEYWPAMLPLRVAFDTRPDVDRALQTVGATKQMPLQACVGAMNLILGEYRDKMPPATLLSLAFETIHGIAKTAPMKDRALDALPQEDVASMSEAIRIEVAKPGDK